MNGKVKLQAPAGRPRPPPPRRFPVHLRDGERVNVGGGDSGVISGARLHRDHLQKQTLTRLEDFGCRDTRFTSDLRLGRSVEFMEPNVFISPDGRKDEARADGIFSVFP